MGNFTTARQREEGEVLSAMVQSADTPGFAKGPYFDSVESLRAVEDLYLTGTLYGFWKGPMMTALAQAVPHLPRLARFNLTQNTHCVDEEVAALVNGLARSTTLKELILEGLAGLSGRRFPRTVQAAADLLQRGGGAPLELLNLSKLSISDEDAAPLLAALPQSSLS